MLTSSAIPSFGITHPLGLPRPIDPDNVFGAKVLFFARNVMPVPTGCLEHFDTAIYRPYLQRVVEALGGKARGWSGAVIKEWPARYCLLRDGMAAAVPPEMRPLLPEVPRVGLRSILVYLDAAHPVATPLQLLDVLTLISEDLGPEKFAAATADHPWVAAFMR